MFPSSGLKLVSPDLEKKIIHPLPEIEPQFVEHPARNVVTALYDVF
jgi:hypothetical protein